MPRPEHFEQGEGITLPALVRLGLVPAPLHGVHAVWSLGVVDIERARRGAAAVRRVWRNLTFTGVVEKGGCFGVCCAFPLPSISVCDVLL